MKTATAILVVLVLLFISTRFIRYIQFAVDGTLSAYAAFMLMALKAPAVAGFLLPMSFFVAILTTMGRLYAENEMAVMSSSGVSEIQLAKMIFPLALAFCFFSGLLAFVVTPWANYQSSVLSSEEAAKSKLGGLIAGRFSESKDNDSVVFIEAKNADGQIENMFAVSGLSEGADRMEIQTATRGQIKQLQSTNDSETETSFLVLEAGNNYAFNNARKRWQITEYERYFMPFNPEKASEVQSKVGATGTFVLLGNSDVESHSELHWRLSAPLSVLILVFLAVPLAKTQPRKGKFSRLFPAIMIYMVYALLMMNGKQLMEDGKVHKLLGFWWIHLVAVIYCIWLYRKSMSSKTRSQKSNNKKREGHV